MPSSRIFTILLITPLFILLSHYLTVFFHEYAHAFMAWTLGVKANPLNLNYGGTSFANLLWLTHIDQNVDYQTILASGHRVYIALIGLAGPWVANGLLFVLSLYLMKKNYIKQSPYLFYFLFWFNLMNLGNLYDYMPIRTLSPDCNSNACDMYSVAFGFNISPWWIFIIGSYIVFFLIWQFFTKTLISAYQVLAFKNVYQRASLMILTVLFLFGFFGGFTFVIFLPNFSANASTSYILSITSFAAIPGIILANWPSRNWVKQMVKN